MSPIPRLLLSLCAAAACACAQEVPASPSEQLQALLKESQAPGADFRKATTDAERNAAVERLAAFAPRFLEFAGRHAADPVALDALLHAVDVVNSADSLTQLSWETNASEFPAAFAEDPAERIVALLLEGHLKAGKLGLVCQRMSYGIRAAYAPFLRRVLEASPHRDVRGHACLSLAQVLNARRQKVETLSDRPELVPRCARLLGAETLDDLRRQDRARAVAEIEALFERAASEFADVRLRHGDLVGDRARSELFEIRELAAGKTAPEIEGVDQDGVRFKLGDYRGKVVLLDFWQEL